MIREGIQKLIEGTDLTFELAKCTWVPGAMTSLLSLRTVTVESTRTVPYQNALT